MPFKDSKMDKKGQVAEMFDQIAFRYDFLNRFLSGGIDRFWRRKAIRELQGIHPGFILDVATGTGDVAIMMAKYLHPRKITGIDISEGMMAIGREKIAKLGLQGTIELLKGDSESIQFEDNRFDAVTVAFGVRNFENLEKGLHEMLRVLKPGGKLVILEFSKPRSRAFKGIYNLYMKRITPGIGKLVSRHGEAYQYLNESVRAFPEGNDLLEIIEKAGFKSTYLRRLSLGICTLYCGQK